MNFKQKIIVLIGVTSFGISTAYADLLSINPLTLVSGPSPFASCTIGAFDNTSVNYVNAEVEPQIAINPTDPSNIIAVWQQDRWNDGGAHGLVTAYTTNGGSTWKTSMPHFTTCAGGTAKNGGNYDRASDPWVTFAPNGDAYQISLSFTGDVFATGDETDSILVSKSTDGGKNWSNPITLIKDHISTSDLAGYHFDDKESITADPTNPNLVYAVWDRGNFTSDRSNFNKIHSSSLRSQVMFSRTTNGGKSWEAPRAIFPANGANQFNIGNIIAVLPNGNLIDVVEVAQGSGKQPPPNPNFFMVTAIISTDKGLTWSSSKPITIGPTATIAVSDPNNPNNVLRTGGGLPSIAVDPNNGTIYVVWEASLFSNETLVDIALSKSTDGGLHWTAPKKVNQTPVPVSAFNATVKVAADGTVAVTYYDFRNNTSDPNVLKTDIFIIHSHDQGATFVEQRLTPQSFDMDIAPQAGGLFIGDYEALTSSGNDFLPFFVITNNGNTNNRTDAFFTKAAQ